jgi:outer membrane protease
VLASRLIFGGLDAVSGEVFARLNHRSGFFVKGYLGAGKINNGHLNDEDFPAGPTYSNTLSSALGHLGYATIDVGYNVWRSAGAKVGPFVGYNYYTQAIDTFGCTQAAGSTPCSTALPAALLGLTESDSFNSLRVGLSSEVMLTERLRLTADAAYVPWVSFSGTDDHLLRQLLLLESAHGNGVMLEASLDYYLTPAWSVGVGARYWPGTPAPAA